MENKSLKTTCSSSKFNLDDLIDDILVEILHRLPCKQASRCKSVSKRWNSLISSPQFLQRFINSQIQLFQNLRLQHHHCSFVLNRLMIPSKSLYSLIAGHQFSELFSIFRLKQGGPSRILGYSNSLLLRGSFNLDYHYWCYVSNIVTKQSIRLPQPPRDYTFVTSTTGFVSDAMGEETIQGVRTVTKFFVVFIRNNAVRCKVGIPILVFSSETGRWEKLFVSCQNQQVFRDREFLFPGVPHNGMLYFYGLRRLLVYDPLKDVSEFHAISNPPNMYICENKPRKYRKIFDVCFGVCCGTLRLCEATYVSYGTVNIKVWELRGFDKETGTGFWHSVHDVCLGPNIWESSVGFRSLRSLHQELVVDYLKLEIELLALHPYNGDILYFRYQAFPPDNHFCCDMKAKRINQMLENNCVAMAQCLFTIPILPPWCPTTPRIHA